jgi:ADP-ribose pyrophosphatase YjhB (NUDIX family)
MELMKDGTRYAWLDMAKRMQALAQAGLEYSDNKYDRDRYQQMRQLSLEIMRDFTELNMDKLVNVFASEQGYQTPKVDVRGVVFRDNQILMVRETIDGNWSLPGGWADVGLTPSEVAIKEVWEESGLVVVPERLLAILDKKMHNHPPDMFHIYKVFILCRETGGELKGGMETSETDFFGPDKFPPLSVPRITREQISLMYEYKNDPLKPATFD